jgi:hypothetical protein
MLKNMEMFMLHDVQLGGIKGLKNDTTKPRWSLLPKGTIRLVIEVLEFGAKKYGFENWKNVENAQQRYYDAAMRHIQSWWNGERIDPETKSHHLAHAVCCLLFLLFKEEAL